MARGHGRILSSIWEDADFIALAPEAQRLYLFLISQPNLNHAGLLPLTLRRWSRKAHGLTATAIEEQLHALEAARFVVLDEDTEELLIRSFVRNDGVWRMPKVMGAAVSGALEIESRKLRQALLVEMDRIPLGDLSDEPAKSRGVDGPSIRAQVAEHISTLRKSFGHPEPNSPVRAPEPPSGTPSGTPSRTPSDTPAEPRAEASTRAPARVSPAPSPVPCPDPQPQPHAGAGARETAPWSRADEAVGEQMLTAWWDQYGSRTAQRRRNVLDAIEDALRNGLDPDELWQALVRLGETSKPVTGGCLQIALSDIRKTATSGEPVQGALLLALPGGGEGATGHQALRGSDANFAGHAALTAQLRAQEAQEKTS
ncbi:hypothetical protein [Streptomyces sp. NPDC006997]|uniref:hypothetical protein n=1 Tax=Streptomyces sp. NPDC006997 TaxID=3155356 RepID=UPI0033F9D872